MKISNRPLDVWATICIRGGGNYQNMYSKSLQKLILGQVALQHSMSMTVPCNLVNSNSLVALYGSISNTYMLSEYSLYCLISTLSILAPSITSASKSNLFQIILSPSFGIFPSSVMKNPLTVVTS